MLLLVSFLISVPVAATDSMSVETGYFDNVLVQDFTLTNLAEITIIDKGGIFENISVLGEKENLMSFDIPLLEFINDSQSTGDVIYALGGVAVSRVGENYNIVNVKAVRNALGGAGLSRGKQRSRKTA